MEKESHEDNNHIVSGDLMAKRKRGRPRKHLKLDSNQQTLSFLPPQQPSQRDEDESMVGQPVSGMIEATFEAGFMLSVKVGNSDSMLRGVVFKPGRCDPVSVDNDIAPCVPMVRRNNDVMVHGSAKVGRKSRFREKRGNNVKSRALVPVPIQPAPTIPRHHLVPVVLQNGGGKVPVNYGPPCHHQHQQQMGSMQTETGSQVSGASNGKPFETLLTQVMKKGQVQPTAQSMEAESEEQALSIEPLQAIHPVHPVHMPKPMPSYGRGKMTELLQAVQGNVRENHFSQGQ